MAETPMEHVSNASVIFSNKFYNVIAEKGQNMIYSPLSAHAILSLVYQGATGETAKSMAEGLYLPDPELAAAGYQSVMTKLNSLSELHLANKLYIHEKYNLKNKFCTVAKECYQSEAENIGFTPDVEAAAKKMNDWVENQTNNKIKNVIDPCSLNCDTRLVLINAIYFKGKWLDCFSEDCTEKEKFYLNDNDTVDCYMMHLQKRFEYGEDDDLDAQIISIPYKNEDLSLMIILPRTKTGLQLLEEKIIGKNLNGISRNLKMKTVILSLPRFRVESTIMLDEPLKKMGMEIIFSECAQFPNLINSPGPLHVSEAVQKSFMEVKEEGVEAAAATAVIVEKVCCEEVIRRKEEPKIFNANHGFFFCLYYRGGTDILPIFVGKMENCSH